MNRMLPPARQALVLSVGAFVLYALTHAPSVQYTDNGELAAAGVTFGVAHPTGYPLFTILTNLWSKVSTDISWLNLLSGLWCAMAVGLMHALVRNVLELVDGQERPAHTIVATVVAGMLGASSIVWSQATSLEVYSLHLCLLVLTLTLLSRSLLDDDRWPRWSVLAGLSYGLMLANHLSSVFLAPGLILLWLSAAREGQIRRWYLVVMPALLGVLLYAVLPLRSAQEPPINWGMVHRSWDAFLYHVKGTQFGVWMFSDRTVFKVNWRIFFGVLSNASVWVGFLPLAIGVWTALRKLPGRGLALIALVLGNLGIALGYSIPDIEPYFLPSVVAMLLFVGIGLDAAARRLPSKALPVLLLVPAISIGVNFISGDRSNHRAVEGYTQWVLANAEPNAVIISRQWDFFISAAWYEQTVRGTRPDVVVIDKELFRRTWYAPYLMKLHPDVMGRAQSQIDAYMPLLADFERDGDAFIKAGRSAEIQARFVEMLNAILSANQNRPLYITQELVSEEPGFAVGWDMLPAGPLIRLVRADAPAAQRVSLAGTEQIVTTLSVPRERLDSSLRDIVLNSLGSTALYRLDAFADTTAFRAHRSIAERIAPSHPVTDRLRSVLP
ncbi:MAG: DUF2723 domain-containing protein [Candidatus Kapabacteria bacterium]|nr:DUF2723 domain-containing protein [Candidatus Kapabacteria bacterium]